MGSSTSEYGGGQATGVGNDFLQWIDSFLGGGSNNKGPQTNLPFGQGNQGTNPFGVGGQSVFNQGNKGGFTGTNQPTPGTKTLNTNPTGTTNQLTDVINQLLSGGSAAGSLNDYSKSLIDQADYTKKQDQANILEKFGTLGDRNSSGAISAISQYDAANNASTLNALGGLQNQRFQLASNNSLNALAMLFQAFQQAVGKGTAQRENITTPSVFSDVLGAAAPIIGTALAPGFGASSVASPGQTSQSMGPAQGTGTQYYGNSFPNNFSGIKYPIPVF